MCRQFLTQLREQYEELTLTGAQLIVITPSNQLLLEKFSDAFGPFPFPIYGDPTRALYKKMGHETMAKWKLMAIAAKGFIKGGKKAFYPEDENQKKVVKISLGTQDVFIQGGTWLYDEKGSIIWSHIDKSPEDHASMKVIFENLP